MLIRVGDPFLASDLCAHFLRSGFRADRTAVSMIHVSRSDAPTAEQERREIEIHLRVWLVTHPAAHVEVL
jgi:hypothetical protein